MTGNPMYKDTLKAVAGHGLDLQHVAAKT